MTWEFSDLFREMDTRSVESPHSLKSFFPHFVVAKIRESLEDPQDGQEPPNKMARMSLEQLEFDGQSSFLEVKTKEEVVRICRFTEDVAERIGIDQKELFQAFYAEVKRPSLELLWILSSQFKLIPIPVYLLKLEEDELQYFTKQFLTLVTNSHLGERRERADLILNDLFEALIVGALCNSERNPQMFKLKVISSSLLNDISSLLIELDDISEFSLLAHENTLTILSKVPLISSVKTRYFTHTLYFILSYKPRFDCLKVFGVLEKIVSSSASNHVLKSATIEMLLNEPQNSQNLETVIKESLNNIPGLNWENLLFTLIVWKRVDEATSLSIIKPLIKEKMVSGLESRNEDKVLTSFILARFYSIIAPQTFPKYEKWYANIFESETHSPAKEPAVFNFLVELLMKCVPVEVPQFLQIQVLKWPFIPSGCKDLWATYVTLAKERITEYNQVEEAMELEPLYQDENAFEVEMAIQTFANYNKIPKSVGAMIFLKRNHFDKVFLPLLLKAPLGKETSDARQRFIEALNSIKKIPPEMYTAYKRGAQNNPNNVI